MTTPDMSEFEELSFLVCDWDSSRPRIVNGWEVLQRVLIAQYQGNPSLPYRVWFWDAEYEGLEKLEVLARFGAGNEHNHSTQIYDIFHKSHPVAHFEVPVHQPARSRRG